MSYRHYEDDYERRGDYRAVREIPTSRPLRGEGPVHRGHDHDQFEIVPVEKPDGSIAYDFR